MVEVALEALTALLQPSSMLYMLLGISIGIVVGVIPGLSGIVGMTIVLPFIYGMDPVNGIAMMLGLIAVIHTSDTFPSVLIGVPGTAGSQATVLDGFQLTRQGQGARALGAAFTASMFGGVFGALVLALLLSVARPLILALGSPELFMLTLFGLSMVAVLAKGNLLYGLLAGLAGLMIGTVGIAPMAIEERYTFGSMYLWDGIPMAPLVFGLFAIPEIIDLLIRRGSISLDENGLSGSATQGIRDAFRNWWLVLRSAGVGAAVGLVPGLGASVVDWIAYGIAKQTVRNERFGTGDIRGVIAPEAANNAKEGGSLVPTLILGIPGSATTAVLIGGLALMGIQAGPTMLSEDLPLTLTVVWTLAFANIFAAALCLILARYVARISTIPGPIIFPFLLVVLAVGGYQSSASWGDLVVLLGAGAVGWLMREAGWPRPPMLIGLVLATAAERYLSISINRYEFEWLTRPGVIIIGLLIATIIFVGGIRRKGRE